MATIREIKNKDGSTSYKITVLVASVDSNGIQKKIRKSTTFKPTEKSSSKIKKQVNAAAVKFEEAVKNGSYFSVSKKLLYPDLVKKWDEEVLSVNVESKKITSYTREKYIRMLELYAYPTLQYMDITVIAPTDISHIITNMIHDDLSSKTIRNAFGALRLSLDYAEGLDLIHSNPCENKNIKNILPKGKTTEEMSKAISDHTFTEDQMQRFLNDALEVDIPRLDEWEKLEDIVYFHLALCGGFRKSEIIGLTWNDILFDSSMISISKAIGYSKDNKEYMKDPKTSKGFRTIPLPSFCFTLLREWYQECMKICIKAGSRWQGFRGNAFNKNYVFIRSDGKRMPLSRPYKHFKQIIRAYNNTVNESMQLPDIRLHDLRHTTASYMLAEGIDPESVSGILGHSKPSFTLNIYGHAMKERAKDAADKMEHAFFKDSIV